MTHVFGDRYCIQGGKIKRQEADVPFKTRLLNTILAFVVLAILIGRSILSTRVLRAEILVWVAIAYMFVQLVIFAIKLIVNKQFDWGGICLLLLFGLWLLPEAFYLLERAQMGVL